MRHFCHLLVGLLAALTLSTGAVHAQPTLAILSSSTIEIPTPTASDYDAGYTVIGRVTYEVSGCTTPQQRCTLGLWAATPFVGGGKSVEEVEWQLDGTADGRWQPLSAIPSDANVGVVAGAAVVSGTLYFRMKLSWARDVAGQSAMAALRLTLTDR